MGRRIMEFLGHVVPLPDDSPAAYDNGTDWHFVLISRHLRLLHRLPHELFICLRNLSLHIAQKNIEDTKYKEG